jgi:hypothetical protein
MAHDLTGGTATRQRVASIENLTEGHSLPHLEFLPWEFPQSGKIRVNPPAKIDGIQ